MAGVLNPAISISMFVKRVLFCLNRWKEMSEYQKRGRKNWQCIKVYVTYFWLKLPHAKFHLRVKLYSTLQSPNIIEKCPLFLYIFWSFSLFKGETIKWQRSKGINDKHTLTQNYIFPLSKQKFSWDHIKPYDYLK